VCGLDACWRDPDTAALEHPNRACGALDAPALGKQTARGEPPRARQAGGADEETAVESDRPDAETSDFASEVPTPVTAVEPLQAVREALGSLRRRRRVATGPLSLGGRVVPEVHASVMDAGIEHG